MTPSRRWSMSVLWLVPELVLVLGAGSAFADYRTRYKAGVSAFSRGRWAEAVTSMQDALAENPRESVQKILIYGSWYEPYIPNYYLGVSLSRLNRCPEALEALRRSEADGVIGSLRKQFGELEAARAKCTPASVPGTSTPDPTPPKKDPTPPKPDLPVDPGTTTTSPPALPKVPPEVIRNANGAIQAAAASASTVRNALAEPRMVARVGQSGFARRERQASEQLESAKRVLQKAAGDASEAGYLEATRLANSARSQFEALGAEAAQIARTLRDEDTQLASAKEALRKQIVTARGLLQTRDDPARADLQVGRTSLSSAIRQSEAALNSVSVAQLQTAGRNLTDASSSLQESRRQRPGTDGLERTVLAQAIRTYLRNDYQGTLAVLSVSAVTSPVAQAQVALFRAAATYSLYEQTGRKDEKQLRDASAELSKYASLTRASPDPRLFTPKFIVLYREVARPGRSR